MKIYCNREHQNKLNQLINDKAALESEFNKKLKQYEAERQSFDDAVANWKDSIRNKIQHIIRKYLTIGPDIAIIPYSDFVDYILYIDLTYQKAPIWRYRITINHGSVDTKCAWDSGNDDRLTQRELVNRLNATAALVNELANTNWNELLDDDIKNIHNLIDSKYLIIKDYPYNDSKYKNKAFELDQQISECELSNLIGKDFWIKCEPYYSDQPCRWLRLYRQIAGKIEHAIIEENRFTAGYQALIAKLSDNSMSEGYGTAMQKGYSTMANILREVDIIHPLYLVTTQDLIDILQREIDTVPNREE